MPDARKRPCCICHHWFRPDPRVGARQRTYGRPECQGVHRRKMQAVWRRRHPDYFAARHILDRGALACRRRRCGKRVAFSTSPHPRLLRQDLRGARSTSPSFRRWTCGNVYVPFMAHKRLFRATCGQQSAHTNAGKRGACNARNSFISPTENFGTHIATLQNGSTTGLHWRDSTNECGKKHQHTMGSDVSRARSCRLDQRP